MALIIHPTFQLYEKKHMPFCSSLQVAEEFGKRHTNVIADIRKLDCSEEFRRLNFQQSYYINEQNKKQPMFIMTKDGFMFLVMGYRGKKAAAVKEGIIKRFNDMEEFIKKYVLATDDFPPFTQAIKDAYDEPQSYHYSNECDLINRIVLGCTAKQFKETHGLGDVPSIRPFLSDIQAKAIRKLQTEDIRLLYTGVEFQDRKDRLVTFYSQKYDIPVLAS